MVHVMLADAAPEEPEFEPRLKPSSRSVSESSLPGDMRTHAAGIEPEMSRESLREEPSASRSEKSALACVFWSSVCMGGLVQGRPLSAVSCGVNIPLGLH